MVDVGKVVGNHGDKDGGKDIHGDDVEAEKQEIGPAFGSTIRIKIVVRNDTIGRLHRKIMHDCIPRLSNNFISTLKRQVNPHILTR